MPVGSGSAIGLASGFGVKQQPLRRFLVAPVGVGVGFELESEEFEME